MDQTYIYAVEQNGDLTGAYTTLDEAYQAILEDHENKIVGWRNNPDIYEKRYDEWLSDKRLMRSTNNEKKFNDRTDKIIQRRLEVAREEWSSWISDRKRGDDEPLVFRDYDDEYDIVPIRSFLR